MNDNVVASEGTSAAPSSDVPAVALVTGGSRGIGAATVRTLVARGMRVCFTYRRDEDAATALLAHVSASRTCVAIRADAIDEESTERAFRAAESLGRVTLLVNNVGMTRRVAPLGSWQAAEIRDVLDVNLYAPLLASGIAARRWTHDPGGRSIVNVSSAAASSGAPREYVAYAAAKAGVDALTVGLAKELASVGIRVNAVAPGTTDTGIHAAAGDPSRGTRVAATVPMNRIAHPQEVAEAIAWWHPTQPHTSVGRC